ncbi:MAG: hypothetical protein GY747_13165 [Planctomycetes bacterium]|nr:hypothetical protein [Planctomycetota bacterium]MCP4772036.1 hypothetical protein [Planctomycetota bacterium]MCP4860296.1 hypothetical protein [Planctomycetota bacterium]
MPGYSDDDCCEGCTDDSVAVNESTVFMGEVPILNHLFQSSNPNDRDPDLPASLDIPNFTILTGKVSGGGLISAEQVAELPAKGYTTIINLQNESEPGVKEERAAAADAGITYISIPCSGSNFTLEDGYRVAAALAENPGHTLFHCRSGGRVSAVWALTRGIVEGLSPEEAAAVAANEGCRPIPQRMIDRVASELTP